MDYPIRPIAPSEAQKFFTSNAIAFGHDPRPEEAIASTLEYADLSRSISVWDGDQVAATAGTWSLEMTTPGGLVPCGGLTWVGVLPSHRRQGILTAMMRYQLDQVRERGEAIAALWASEAIIYQRFGYGMAAEGVELAIDRTRTALRTAPPFSGRCRYIQRDEALVAWPGIWDTDRVRYPGMHSRSAGWWENRVLRDPPWPGPAGFSSLFNVQYEEGGKPLGYDACCGRFHHPRRQRGRCSPKWLASKNDCERSRCGATRCGWNGRPSPTACLPPTWATR